MDHNQAEETYNHKIIDWRTRLTSAAHHLGTVRMGGDPNTSCVDSSLRLFGSEKIFVCDGSVFPTGGNANPTYTCMALADRLAVHLTT